MSREKILKQYLDTVKREDYILIDCMPSLGMLTINALADSGTAFSFPCRRNIFQPKVWSSFADCRQSAAADQPRCVSTGFC